MAVLVDAGRPAGVLFAPAEPWRQGFRPGLRHLLDQLTEPVPVLRRLRAARRLRHRMQAALGYRPDLRHPRTFNEKIAWRMLHDRNPLIPLTIDKLAVRDWVAGRIGPELLTPLYGTWDRASDIDWDALPERFVLKATHGWNMNLLVHNKAMTDRTAVCAMAEAWLGRSHYTGTDEWGYRDIPHRLLAEEMLLDEAGNIPTDLKFHVFNGRVGLLGVHNGRFGNHRVAFFDSQMRRLPMTQGRPADMSWLPPANMAELVAIAERLGAAFDYVRVDLYLVRGAIRFGELTHYDSGACSPYVPAHYDRIIGDMWQPAVSAGSAGTAPAGPAGS